MLDKISEAPLQLMTTVLPEIETKEEEEVMRPRVELYWVRLVPLRVISEGNMTSSWQVVTTTGTMALNTKRWPLSRLISWVSMLVRVSREKSDGSGTVKVVELESIFPPAEV